MYDFAFCTFHEFMSLSRFCNKNGICDNPEFVNNQKFKQSIFKRNVDTEKNFEKKRDLKYECHKNASQLNLD